MADVERPGDCSEQLPPAGVGEGPMLPSLMRFNWGAFFLPALWGVVYGVWPIVGLWLVASIAPLFLGIVVGVTGSDGTVSIPSLIAITVISDAFLAYVRLWTGGSANKLYWERESRRLLADPAARPKSDCVRFKTRQRTWATWGVVGALISLGLTLAMNYSALKPYGYSLSWAFVAEPVVFLGAQIGLGVWLATRMRAEFPEVEEAGGPPEEPSTASDEGSSGGDS